MIYAELSGGLGNQMFVYAFENCGIGYFSIAVYDKSYDYPSFGLSVDSFLRVFEVVFDKREQRFGSAGKFGHDFRDFEGSFRCFGSGCRAIFRLNFRGFGEYFFNFGLKRLLVCTALVGSYDSQEKG